jgi:hypothetical protein
VNDVAGFIGLEVFKNRHQLVRCCLEDIVMDKLHGLCIRFVCSTLRMSLSLDDLDWCMDQIMPSNPACWDMQIPDVQIVISDGLDTNAIMDPAPSIAIFPLTWPHPMPRRGRIKLWTMISQGTFRVFQIRPLCLQKQLK